MELLDDEAALTRTGKGAVRILILYRKFGFEIDPDAATDHVVPHAIMRREGA